MGGGNWNSAHYISSKATRAATNTPDFAYTIHATKTHDNLDPKRINAKPFGKLESRDSADHPESNPVLVIFDVTGSNKQRAVVAQQRLPKLMELLKKYLTDAQVAVAANDDYKVVQMDAVQISDFESDIRVDEHLRNIRLIGCGGGNDGESYDLMLYAAARKVALDSVEKRGKKGYLFMYADEPLFDAVDKHEVQAVYGDTLERNIPIAEIIEETRRLWNVFVVFPIGGYDHARRQYVDLFGADAVLDLQAPDLICELIASTIGLYEKKVTATSLVTDLVAVGVSANDAHTVSKSLVKTGHQASVALKGGSTGPKAARL